jgi:hypothetical protein
MPLGLRCSSRLALVFGVLCISESQTGHRAAVAAVAEITARCNRDEVMVAWLCSLIDENGGVACAS